MRTLMTMSLLLAAVLGGCAAAPVSEAAPPEKFKVQVLSKLPHDPAAFTQGLEFSGETLYEGTGLVGKSSMRAGPAGAAPTVRQDLPGLFGEGITVLGPTVWQITWQDGVAIERDAKTLAELRRVNYTGEGWGLCHRESTGQLVMSDGSSKLTFRDPVSFAPTGGVDVGRDQLNELECVGDSVYANVWQTDRILRIDAATGRVTGEIDASGLLEQAERGSADVLNGIAAVPGTDEFVLTGKLWPRMFRVKFVPAA
ncbi:glutaminyl-peptide cyclotransferase [Amycolatopsis sp. WAC 01376]|uniref:glutaminyl-peptide cyclotransferase n=1 Tax=Amycolatopsis sp. WAC 01376 TaxID=2203195 RepID=UPI000F775490|nr:glutaminyl-peptide cyclotransferase [Amycolatopsis sp. WAC 01376]RSM67136.1 glutaminyl-peptide cyclotransferase [Amycolatopsis sp. WAC 01376]